MLNRHGGEERFEGWWGPANSSLGARINAIILFQECALKMLELLGVQQEALKDLSSSQTQNLAEVESSRQEDGVGVSQSKTKQPQNHRARPLLSPLLLAQLCSVHIERGR